MVIVTTFIDGAVCPRFGKTPAFKSYTIENGEIASSSVHPVEGAGHMALTAQLVRLGCDVLICGGLGAPAAQAVKAAGIDLYAGFEGEADAVVEDFLAGKLEKNEAANAGHRHDGQTGCGCQ